VSKLSSLYSYIGYLPTVRRRSSQPLLQSASPPEPRIIQRGDERIMQRSVVMRLEIARLMAKRTPKIVLVSGTGGFESAQEVLTPIIQLPSLNPQTDNPMS